MAPKIQAFQSRVLEKCEFEDASKGRRSKHRKWKLVHNGKTVAWTSLSHGKGEIPPPVFKKMLSEQLFLSEEEFEEIFSCTKGAEFYEDILRRQGKLN